MVTRALNICAGTVRCVLFLKFALAQEIQLEVGRCLLGDFGWDFGSDFVSVTSFLVNGTGGKKKTDT